MTNGPLLDRIARRVAIDKDEGDIAYFHALTLQLEYFTKVITAGVVACIADDIDRHRYSLEHTLVRANSMGDWAEALNNALIGSAAQFFDSGARDIVRSLTERVGDSDWRHRVVALLADAALSLGAPADLGTKVALRQAFPLAVAIRNRSRGHGATTTLRCNRLCPLLANAAGMLEERLPLFSVPWVYLHRNLSGKYRVEPLLGDPTPFDQLKGTRDARLFDGVYMHLLRAVHVPLLFSDATATDILLPNGNHDGQSFELLSYSTGATGRIDSTAWSAPPGQLPPSETEGRPALDQVGNTFANLPPKLVGYVPRPALENRVRAELLTRDRHPIVSLTGPGGIGKTSIAIAAILEITALPEPPYQVVLWLSARDIDLLESGPKPVTPRVVTQRDIARAVTNLLEPSGHGEAGFRPEDYVRGCLAEGAAGPTLFVFDNFETVASPADVLRWVDACVRPPNKVLITTRSKDFEGDYRIKIGGMTDDEAHALVTPLLHKVGMSL